MDFAVKPIFPIHSPLRYRPRKIRDQSEFFEQAARCIRNSAQTAPKHLIGYIDVPVDMQESHFSAFG